MRESFGHGFSFDSLVLGFGHDVYFTRLVTSSFYFCNLMVKANGLY